MTLMEVIDSLNKQFISRYGKQFSELNKNVYPSARNDRGSYEVPVPVVGKGGGTFIKGTPDVFTLEPPAMVNVQLKNMKPEQLIYRLAIPYSEAEIAAGKPEYFNYLFDAVLSKGLGNYQATIGGPDRVRFGESFCTYQRPDSKDVFKQLEDTSLELRLYGSFAGNEEDLA